MPTPKRRSQPSKLTDLLTLDEIEELAKVRMSHMAYEYVSAAAADEYTLRWNRESYSRLRIRPRVLRDVGRVSTEVTLLGRGMPHPIVLAPAAYQRLMHKDGELATARGAGAARATLTVSSCATASVEEIAKVATSPLWFQIYVQADREFTRAQIQRAEGAGCSALVLTVDTPTLGARNRQAKAKFALPAGVTCPHLMPGAAESRSIIDPTLTVVTWKDVGWIRSFATVPLLLKGILDPDDAALAIGEGGQGIIVSNHGARNLDTVPATIDALPSVIERVSGRVPVLVDGGIRRGTDVLKAMALGASAVLVGRPYCYGLAAGGADGVHRVVEILRRELEMAMMLAGWPSLRDVNRALLW
jgi:4-hydroxymandelate oxidase